MKNVFRIYSYLYNVGLFKNMIIKKVTKSNNARFIYHFSKNANKLNDNHLTKIVDKLIILSRGYTLYSFVKEIKVDEENLDKITNVIINASDPKLIYNYYAYIKPRKVDAIIKIMNSILKFKDPEYIYLFALNLKVHNNRIIDILVNAIINTGNSHYMNMFLNNIKDISMENKKQLIDCIVIKADPSSIHEIAVKNNSILDENNVTTLVNRLLKANINEDIYMFLRDVKNISRKNIDKLLQGIIIGSSEYIYYTLRDVNLTLKDKSLLINRLCVLGNSKYIGLTLKDIQLPINYVIMLYDSLLLQGSKVSYEGLNIIHNMYNEIDFLESSVLKSKRMCTILDYIYLKKDIELAKILFGNIKDFYDISLITKDIHFNVNNLNSWLDEYLDIKENYNYVDDNIDNYLSQKHL